MRPASEAELAEAIAGAKGALAIRGGGTRGVSVEGAPLETRGLSGISLYEPAALTLVAGAGTPLAEIEAVLAQEGQRLAFEPVDHRGLFGITGEPTIGGVFAGNICGPRRVQVGAARDFLLGVRFVDGLGRVIGNGGRVMKNVTGYDLVKLMAGSWGTLGVLSEVSFKVLPAPEALACVLIYGLDDASAIRVLARALGSPFDVSGAAHVPVGIDGHPVTMIRIEGFEGSVRYRAEKLLRMFTGLDARIEDDPIKVTAGWKWLRDVQAWHGLDGDIWRISCRPGEAPSLVSRADAQQVIYDWGGGLIWLRMAEGADLRGRLGAFDGHATCLRGSAQRFPPQPEPVAALSRGIRARFDPRGILNAGVMGG